MSGLASWTPSAAKFTMGLGLVSGLLLFRWGRVGWGIVLLALAVVAAPSPFGGTAFQHINGKSRDQLAAEYLQAHLGTR